MDILSGAADNTIGGVTTGAGNTIVDNKSGGLDIDDFGTSANVVEGNFIGTNASGGTGLGNALVGLTIFSGATGNTIGGTTTGAANTIASNGAGGVDIESSGTSGNVALGNFIGTNASGATGLGNSVDGLQILGGATDNTIGGTTTGAGNTIASNLAGVVITDAGTSGNVVEGNFIGTNASRATGLGNVNDGVDILSGATGNTIGGTTTGAANTIVENKSGGLDIENSGTSANLVEGNFIGTNASGGTGLGNALVGLTIFSGATGNTIGGTTTGAANTIASNGAGGVDIESSGTSGNVVEGNFIGTNASSATGLGNSVDGVEIIDASGSTIGGTTAGAANVIAHNSGPGIEITSDGTSPASGNLIVANFIGTNSSGTNALGNSGDGVYITGGASSNTVGGAAGSGNTIAFNILAGVVVGTSTTSTESDDAILGNSIFSNGALGIDLGDDGVTMNTPGGPHTGPNHLQNYPVTTSATIAGGTTTIGGTFNSTSSTTFTLQFFANAAADPSGFGQGQTFLGQTTVTTGEGGNATFSVSFPSPPAAQDIVTATATDPNGNTSEFSQALVASLVVTNTNDSGPGSLRAVIQLANGLTGLQTITFDIPSEGGVQTIKPLTPLPAITTPVKIDGTSQPGYFGTPVIDIDGSLAGASADGLQLATTAAGSTIVALAIGDFGGDGINVGSAGNQLIGDYIGVAASGASAAPNGLGLSIGTSGNTVGGTTATARNVISGNTNDGISITAGTGNLIEGNFIGTNAAGTSAVGNGVDGVLILSASNTVGGTTAGARNIISGNVLDGVSMTDGGANNNLVEGNYIGTDVTGKLRLGNVRHGVSITSTNATTNPTGTNNTIGGTVSGAGNILSGNGAFGLVISAPNGGGTGNLVEGNFIGTDSSGALPLGNAGDGIVISSAGGNTVGGTTAAARNVISGNAKFGIDIEEATSTGNLVEGNYIGTDLTGKIAIGNQSNGVNIQLSAVGNTVGGVASGAGNLIAGGVATGIVIQSGATGNLVQGNFIGTDATGNAALGNVGNGILILDASSNTIGGTTAAARNVISGNAMGGVVIQSDSDGTAASNLVEGNYIGISFAGTGALGNTTGVTILDSSSNTIGGTAAGAGNIISSNLADGISITGSASLPATGNLVQGNLIGTTASGAALGNMGNGVDIFDASGNTVGGTTAAARNVISASTSDGVLLDSDGRRGHVEQRRRGELHRHGLDGHRGAGQHGRRHRAQRRHAQPDRRYRGWGRQCHLGQHWCRRGYLQRGRRQHGPGQ